VQVGSPGQKPKAAIEQLKKLNYNQFELHNSIVEECFAISTDDPKERDNKATEILKSSGKQQPETNVKRGRQAN